MRKILRKKAKIFLRFSLFSPPKDELILSGLLVGVDNLARWVQVEEKDKSCSCRWASAGCGRADFRIVIALGLHDSPTSYGNMVLWCLWVASCSQNAKFGDLSRHSLARNPRGRVVVHGPMLFVDWQGPHSLFSKCHDDIHACMVRFETLSTWWRLGLNLLCKLRGS